MIGILRSQILKTGSVKVHTTIMLVIRIFFLIKPRSHKVYPLLTGIHKNNLAHYPFSTCDLILDLSGLSIYAI